MHIDREITYRNKQYHIKGYLPICDTPSERARAASECTVKVLATSREHDARWRTLNNGPTKYRVIGEAMRRRGFHALWATHTLSGRAT